jgi:O-antigen ligase
MRPRVQRELVETVPASRSQGVRGSTVLLLVAIAYAALAQGAFYWGQLRVTVVLVCGALVLSLRESRLSRRDFDGPVWAAFALALWYVVAALRAHDAAGAGPAVAVLFSMIATVLIVRRADAFERRWALIGLLSVGALIAASGWEGVAFRQAPRAIEDGGLWRAASTITYANATGGVLAALALVGLGLLVVGRPDWPIKLVTYLLVLGLFATASRAGILAFSAGLIVLTVLTKGQAIARGAPIVVGALVAFAALLPSMPATHQPQPLLACIGLAVGALVAVVRPRIVGLLAAAMLVVLVAVPGLRGSTVRAASAARQDRLTVSSPDRSHELHAALHLARENALAGVGPGRVELMWVSGPASTVQVTYAHNEYLQVLDEAGLVGGVIVLVGFTTVAVALWRARHSRHIVASAGCLSALVAFAVHSSLDFLWHVPLIPITGAVLVGALLARPAEQSKINASRSNGGT